MLVFFSIWWRHLFCKCCFFQLIPSTSQNGSLRNFNTGLISVCSRTLRRDFWLSAHQKFGVLNSTCFCRLHNSTTTLSTNISGLDFDIDNRETALKAMECPLRRPKILWTSVHNWLKIGPSFLLTLRKFSILVHCQASHTAWRRWPSLWPALQHGNICSCILSCCEFVCQQQCLSLALRPVLLTLALALYALPVALYYLWHWPWLGAPDIDINTAGLVNILVCQYQWNELLRTTCLASELLFIDFNKWNKTISCWRLCMTEMSMTYEEDLVIAIDVHVVCC